MTENSNETMQAAPQTNGSTLIEFPGVHRNRPAWRKELSERFREIQQKRAREAALESEDSLSVEAGGSNSDYSDAATVTQKGATETAKQLGLVPPQPTEAVEMNPIVQAALRRIERARKPNAPPLSRGGSNRTPATATAAARVVEEELEPSVETRREPAPRKRPETLTASSTVRDAAEQSAIAEKAETGETARASSFSVVAPKQAAASPAQADAGALTSEPTTRVTPKSEPAAQTVLQAKADAPAAKMLDGVGTTVEAKATVETNASKAEAEADATQRAQPRRVAGVIDDHWLERRGVETLPKVETVELTYDDRAPLLKRFAAAFVDLLIVAFLSAPFAAVIELSIGNWSDPRVWGSMGGIVVVVAFLYLTCSLALASRTLGMKLFSMHTVDAESAHAPTTGQCARRSLVYMLSLATFGLGILYALFDAEGRAAHDILSRTVVVKQ
jgi:uncharacterized RDD family membrane protein YckC